jgi:hypothetical protein
MDLSALIVVIAGTVLFFGFAVWMAFYSRQREETGEPREGE